MTFLVRTFRTTEGEETWDFGDGSPAAKTQSDGGGGNHATDGYAAVTHRFERAGHYLVRVERTSDAGLTAIGHLHVTVDPADQVGGEPADAAKIRSSVL